MGGGGGHGKSENESEGERVTDTINGQRSDCGCALLIRLAHPRRLKARDRRVEVTIYNRQPPTVSAFIPPSSPVQKPQHLPFALDHYPWHVPSKLLANPLVVCRLPKPFHLRSSRVHLGKAPRKQLAAKSAARKTAAVSPLILSMYLTEPLLKGGHWWCEEASSLPSRNCGAARNPSLPEVY